MKIFFPALFALLSFVGCSKPSALKTSMEEMGESYKPMSEAQSLGAMRTEVADFKTALNTAAMQKVKPDDQATFDEGMKKLDDLVKELDSALAANDEAKAKEIVAKLGDTRKKYHKELGVKKK